MKNTTVELYKNSLTSTHPNLVKEWCFERNVFSDPEDVSASSNLGAWWVCPEGHPEYWMLVRTRTKTGSGCPVCQRIQSNREKKCSILDSELRYWIHPTRNKGVILELISKSSPELLHWKCERGHDFKRTVSYHSKKMDCPVCNQEAKQKKDS